MTMTVLDRTPAAGDAGRVTGDQKRPDPEVPERARRRTFTALYKQEVLAAYEAARTTRAPRCQENVSTMPGKNSNGHSIPVSQARPPAPK
jgi:hypothetical protein